MVAGRSMVVWYYKQLNQCVTNTGDDDLTKAFVQLSVCGPSIISESTKMN